MATRKPLASVDGQIREISPSDDLDTSTDALPEGSTNLYHTPARVRALLASVGSADANLAINPSGLIAQAGAADSTVSGAYFCDMWSGQWSVGPGSIVCGTGSTPSDVKGDSTAAAIVCLTAQASISAGQFASLVTAVEGFRLRGARWGTAQALPITFSFRAFATAAGSYGFSVANAALNRSWSTTMPLSAGWNDVSISVPGPTGGVWNETNGVGLFLRLSLAAGVNSFQSDAAWVVGNFLTTASQTNGMAGSGRALRIKDLRINLGLFDVGYVARPFQIELALCQRYYEQLFEYGVAPGPGIHGDMSLLFLTTAQAAIYSGLLKQSFLVHKRAVPTMTYFSTATGAPNRIRDAQNGVDVNPSNALSGARGAYTLCQTAAVAAQINLQCGWTANARI